jgi:hypothetical protein
MKLHKTILPNSAILPIAILPGSWQIDTQNLSAHYATIMLAF